MKPAEINVAIAELCGWIGIHTTDLDRGRLRGTKHGEKPYPAREIPDYHSSLDACAEFRKSLTDDQKLLYTVHLSAAVGASDYSWQQDWKIVDATAPNHCEAFLRLHGKWEEGKRATRQT